MWLSGVKTSYEIMSQVWVKKFRERIARDKKRKISSQSEIGEVIDG